MSRKKLTLTVDEDAIKKARRYSTSRGTSISELVSRLPQQPREPRELDTNCFEVARYPAFRRFR